MRKPLRGIAQAMLFCMGFHWIKVKGRLSRSEEAPILAAAPHSSFIDALALAVICTPSPISRKENDSIPLIGGNCYCQQSLLVVISLSVVVLFSFLSDYSVRYM